MVRKDGHIYFTDPAFGDQADTRELDFYGVYHITPKGQMSLIAKPAGPAQRHRVFAQRTHSLRRQLGRPQQCAPTTWITTARLPNERVSDFEHRGRAGRHPHGREGQSLRGGQGRRDLSRRTASRCTPFRAGGNARQLRLRRRGLPDAVHHGADVGLPRAAGREGPVQY